MAHHAKAVGDIGWRVRPTRIESISTMKRLNEYIERAKDLERLAADERDAAFKAELLDQAAAYRKLAARRARQHGLPPPEAEGPRRETGTPS
jgi:hypothetical protein